jgi:hypothetical protein
MHEAVHMQLLWYGLVVQRTLVVNTVAASLPQRWRSYQDAGVFFSMSHLIHVLSDHPLTCDSCRPSFTAYRSGLVHYIIVLMPCFKDQSESCLSAVPLVIRMFNTCRCSKAGHCHTRDVQRATIGGAVSVCGD